MGPRNAPRRPAPKSAAAAAPDQLHVADFTCVPLASGFGCTAFVIDACAGYIGGWECSRTKPNLRLD